MVRTISEGYKRSRKVRVCRACENILNYGSFEQFIKDFKPTLLEEMYLMQAKENKYRIQVGQRYYYQFNEESGDIYNFDCIPEIHDICVKYNIYPDYD